MELVELALGAAPDAELDAVLVLAADAALDAGAVAAWVADEAVVSAADADAVVALALVVAAA